jgi:hypothetical protein
MVQKNKLLLLASLAVLALWLLCHLFYISGNWAEAASRNEKADAQKELWEKNFSSGPGLMPKKQALDELAGNQKAITDNLKTLKQIEFGTADTLRGFSVGAGGAAVDEKSFLSKKRINLIERAKTLNIPILPAELSMGAGEKAEKDPVAINLLRLAMVDHFLTACQRAGISQIRKVDFSPPKLLRGQEDEEEGGGESSPSKGAHDDKSQGKGKDAEKNKAAAAGGDKLVQFHMKVTVLAAEQAFGKLLFELQKPSEATRGYLCLRGFHVTVRDSGSGRMEAALAVSALLSEKTLQDLKIQAKIEEEKRGPAGRSFDMDRL